MEATTENKSTRMDWILFGVSAVVCILFLMYMAEFFWVILPFVLTFLVKALRAI